MCERHHATRHRCWGHRCWVIVVGSSLLGHRCWVIVVGSSLLGHRCWVIVVGSSLLGHRCWVIVVGSSLLGHRCWVIVVWSSQRCCGVWVEAKRTKGTNESCSDLGTSKLAFTSAAAIARAWGWTTSCTCMCTTQYSLLDGAIKLKPETSKVPEERMDLVSLVQPPPGHESCGAHRSRQHVRRGGLLQGLCGGGHSAGDRLRGQRGARHGRPRQCSGACTGRSPRAARSVGAGVPQHRACGVAWAHPACERSGAERVSADGGGQREGCGDADRLSGRSGGPDGIASGAGRGAGCPVRATGHR